jgi:hypothetical protein
MLSRSPGLRVINGGSDSFNCKERLKTLALPVASLRRASRHLSAAAGDSGTRFSLLRVAPPSACPKHASVIQEEQNAH